MKTQIQNPKSAIQNAEAPKSVVDQARQYLVGGVNSPVRAFRHTGGDPLILQRARGATVVDVTGARLIDFLMGWGALVLGHNHPAVVQALRQALRGGALMGLTHPAEAELARLIAEAVPSVEQVRFTTSGTEACMTAVRLARACTGRAKILTFEGCYHGHGDPLLAGKSAGIPEGTARDTLAVPYNDLPACEEAIRRHGTELACVIVEPVAANMGVVPPEPGYLARLRDLTRRHGILLIFDEVVTGFRLGRGGAQAALNVEPDLTTFGKIIGGGLPIGAVGGPRRLMRRLAPEGEAYHGGTFAGHPLSMAAGIATLSELKSRPPYERIERLAQCLADGLQEAAQAAGIPVQVSRVGSMLTLFFTDQPVKRLDHAKAGRADRFGRWANALRAEGVLIPPSPYEALFVSSAHTDVQIERLLRASERALTAMGPGAS